MMKPTRLPVRLDGLLRSLHSPATSRICRTSPQCLNSFQMRTFIVRPRTNTRAVENLNVSAMRYEAFDHHIRRRNFMLAGTVFSFASLVFTSYMLYKAATNPKKLDSKLPEGLDVDPFRTEAGSKRKTVVHDADGNEIVPTGYSVVPSFPRTIDLQVEATSGDEQQATNGVEYTLVGLGMRSVSFLGIYVYLVGYYVATQDVAAIQSKLIKEINPIATTLVPAERDELRRLLMDPVEGEKLWLKILQDAKPRSVFRIVPVKNTDFHHLRDGFVRSITARSQADAQTYGDDTFGESVKEFRDLFNRGKVPTGRELLMIRDERGVLTVMFDEGTGKGAKALGTVGRVNDERISRALWMNYLAGRTVASEPARTNIVDGILEFVERPIGTVASQVV